MQNLENGCTVWFTGLSGAGKSTVSSIIETELQERDLRVEVLDGDVIRTHLSKGLGFSKADRDTNIRRIGWVCEVLSRNGVVAVAAAISPYHEIRDEVRGKVGRFVEVYMECPVPVLAERDVKGLYKKALAGDIHNVTSVENPYEPPPDPEVVCHTDGHETPEQSAAKVICKLEELGYIPVI